MELLKKESLLIVFLFVGLLITHSTGILDIQTADNSRSNNPIISVDRGQLSRFPPGYFDDAKPAVPLPESKMITIILNKKTLSNSVNWEKSGLIEIPKAFLDLNSMYTPSKEYSTHYIQKALNPNEDIVVIRMPQSLFGYFISIVDKGENLTLPASHFSRLYKNFADMDSHMQSNGDTVEFTSRINPTIQIPSLLGIPEPIITPVTTEKRIISVSNEIKTGIKDVSYGEDEWVFFTRKNQTKRYIYCIGQISPYLTYFSGEQDYFYSPHEREYYLSPNMTGIIQDTIEIIVNYDHSTYEPDTGLGNVYLFPAIYDQPGTDGEPIEEWEDPGPGIIRLDPTTFPHAYGYHVILMYWGGYTMAYWIIFEDMDTLTWFPEYIYNDGDDPSYTFATLAGSAEHEQVTPPIDDYFVHWTQEPGVMDEWALEYPTGLGQLTWKKPIDVWEYSSQSSNMPYSHIDYLWGGWNNCDLITRSYTDFRWT